MSKGIEGVREIRDIQGNNGNWDYSEYMWGLFNGLELALAIMEDRDPQFRDAPKRFATDKTEEDKTKQGWFDKLHRAWGKR